MRSCALLRPERQPGLVVPSPHLAYGEAKKLGYGSSTLAGRRKKRRRPKKRQRHSPTERLELSVQALGRHGDGIADHEGRRIFVAGALPGERVEADVRGERAELRTIVRPSPDRTEPFCPHFGFCGGCVAQHMTPDAYNAWKQGIVATALANKRLNIGIDPLIDTHGEGRRRVTVHAKSGNAGLMRARSHELLNIEHCPVLVPKLANVFATAIDLVAALKPKGKQPVDIVAIATQTGIDVKICAIVSLDYNQRMGLTNVAEAHGLARLSIDDDPIVERKKPLISVGSARLSPPPGNFLQVTEAGETALTSFVTKHAKGAKRVADLFCGVGPFALSLAESVSVHAVDTDGDALAALTVAANRALNLKPITTERRDLIETPLGADELARYDAVIFDPPRAGAEAQARELAVSEVRTVIAISCQPTTFARDAAVLVEGGYELIRVTPIDQFKYTAHVETAALFQRP